ncbi:MAG: SpaA isopeptide-forming pilin-related protein [Eubacteriales bacterium]|nr:SpaA isopeptide-forming pilin-related protein [Eubacteriales bacterium]
MRKGRFKRVLSGLLAVMTVMTTMMSPMVTYAQEPDTMKQKPPLYEEVKDLLDQDEVVKAEDLELDYGASFDVKIDFSKIEIPDNLKVKVTFEEAKNAAGEDFTTQKADTYKAVYYVEPLKTDHPKYQISRNLIVKEAPQTEVQTEVAGESQDNGGDSGEEAEEGDAESHSAVEGLVGLEAVSLDTETMTEATETKGTEEIQSEAAESEEAASEVDAIEEGTALTDEEFDAELEATEDQELVDPESGVTLSEVMEEAVEQEIHLEDLEIGESVTFIMPMLLATETGSQHVTVTRGSWYHYADYGLGSYITAPYYVHWGSISATAYCVQPSKTGPDDGTYQITKLADSKTLAKVCYYGTKASDENGFFDEKHPDFSTGKRFIITHLAASLANGSSDWDSGTNATGRSLAKELYNYCVNMPEIPDVDMSFSEDNVKAYIEGNAQRTKVITFKADSLQTITFNLPKGVKLVNVSTGKTSAAGASVEISGGTQFYLTAPLSQSVDVSDTFSTKMKGSIDKEYSAYKITTGSSSQDLALVFGEGVGNEKYISFKVTWTKECYVSIVKKDQETSNALAGAVYGIYSDAACKNLIAQMPATDANGASKVTLEKTQDVVYLKEITAPDGYVLDTKAVNVALTEGQTTVKNVTDKRVSVSISLAKQDAETGRKAQGDASLKGAVYGLYALEDIVHPDGKSGVLFKAGDQVATLTTNEDASAKVDNLYLGKYFIKEITAPTGYLLDTTEYPVDCLYAGQTVAIIEGVADTKDSVMKQPFEIIKAANNGKTDADLLKGAGFSAWLVSSLKKNADGSFDFASADPVVLTADGQTEMFTDAKGYACSIPLPYGKYIVKETTTPHNYDPVDDFYVTITENKPNTPQVWHVLLDKEFEAKLKVIKKDDETKRSILVPGAEFKIYDLTNEKYVEQVTTYPVVKTHKSYFTDAKGYLILPNNLKIGNYRIEEVTAPDGYLLNDNYVEISVDANTAYQEDETSGDTIIEVTYEDHAVKGEIAVYKKGEVLVGYNGKAFEYEEQFLKGAEFEIYAAENIYTADYQKDASGNRLLEYAEGALVTRITTDESGLATAKDLPLGKYLVKEAYAPEGFVLQAASQEMDLVYADQNTAVIKESVTFTNDRQKVAVTVTKQDAENEAVLGGAEFGIYNTENIVNAEGSIIVEANTLLEKQISDEKGNATFTLDLPLGQYYVKELQAPAGFVSSDEVLAFDAAYQGQDIPVIRLHQTKKNTPTTFEFTKADATTGVELDGATLTVLDKDGNTIDSWTSVKDQPHVIKRLIVGETYTLREEFAPYGYLKATDVKFTVEDTAEIQKVEMKDEVPTALLIINKKGQFLDNVSLAEHAKGTVEHIFEYVTGSLSEVTFEIYAAEDIKAADGVSDDYYKADQLIGTITTDENGIAQMGELPVGKYYVKEAKTAHGYVLDGEPRYVDLSYRDQDTPVVTYDEDWQNNRQRVSVNVLKKEKDSDRLLEGATFGLYAAEDIVSASGKVLIEADEIIELKATDANGQIKFIADLPVDGKYYVKEIYAPDGFVTTEEKQEFTFEYGDDKESVMIYNFTFENEPTTVEITKADLTNGKEIPGAHLKVTDKDGNVIDEWTSTEEPHVIKELVVGKTYTLTETKPADGYVTAESISFVIENTAEVQKHEMLDDVTKVKIRKTDITGDTEIPGAKLTILDEDDQVVESWTSTNEPHYVEKLPIGKYTLREEQAPKGFILTNDVTFEVADTGEIQMVAMKNDTAKGKVIINKTDADNEEPLKGVEFELRDSNGKVLEKLVTDAAGHAESGLYEIATYKNGEYAEALKYYLVETKALEGYTLDETKYEIVFEYADQNTPVIEVLKDLKNKEKTPEQPGNPGNPGSNPKTGDTTNLWLPIALMIGAASLMAGILAGSKRRKKSNRKADK